MTDEKNMNEQQKLAVVLKYQGALVAEEQLTDLANKEGDEAVARISERLTAAEVSQVTSRADLTSPSILHTVVSLEQFQGVFRRVGVNWSAADEPDCSPETLVEFEEELKQFLCAFILLSDDEARRIELLKIILNEPYGLDALGFSVVHEKDFPDFIASNAAGSNEGDWREVMRILQKHFPEEWETVKEFALFDQNTADYFANIQDIAARIFDAAVTEGAVQRKKIKAADDIFTPLPKKT